MDGFVGTLIAETLKLGFPGVVILYLGYVNLRLTERMERMQVLRMEERAQNTATMTTMADSLRTMSDAIDGISATVTSTTERISVMAAILNERQRN